MNATQGRSPESNAGYAKALWEIQRKTYLLGYGDEKREREDS